MDYRAQYRQLVRELERLGGDLRGVPAYYSLEAEAKVRRLIKERQGGGGEPPRAKDKGELPFAPTVGGEQGGEQAKREDLIADYPVALSMDNYDVVLQYWRDHKRILEPVREDYSRLTPVELVQRRNTLRSNIVSREKSLAKWEEQAKREEGMSGRSLWVLQEKIARKREEVEQMKLQVKEIEKLMINVSND